MVCYCMVRYCGVRFWLGVVGSGLVVLGWVRFLRAGALIVAPVRNSPWWRQVSSPVGGKNVDRIFNLSCW